MNALWSELRPLLRTLAVFSFFINLLFIVPAVFTLQVFDRVLPSNSTDTLIVLLVGTFVALSIMLFLDYVRTRLQHVLGSIVDERLSPPVVHAVVERAARRPDLARGEAIVDVAALRNVFTANGLVALFDAPWIFIYVLVIWCFHPLLGIGAAISALLMLGLAWLNDRVGRTALEALQQDQRRASRYVESSLRNAEVLQALGMTGRLLWRWRRFQDQVVARQADASRSGVAFSSTTKVMRQAIQIVMLGLGAWLVLSQQASAGIMIATTILLGRAVQPVEQLVSSWKGLTDARAAYGRLTEVSDPPGRAGEPMKMPRPDGYLVIEGATWRVPETDRVVLYGVQLALAAGESLAIVGPSGSGKSTLARLITGVWVPTTGIVRLDGVDVAYWPREDLGRWIGYVPQDVELFDGTVAENIARLGEVDALAVVEAAKRANFHEMILTLPQGYDTPCGEHGLRLSPGQRQRVAVARALLGDPRLVVLDEPNSNLDGAGEVALAQALSGLRNDGVTVVVISHRPALIAHVDKILVLEAGRVVQFGPTAEVMKVLQRNAQVVTGDKAA